MAVHISAGLLMCRRRSELEFFLVHPGGPFFKNKNFGVWSIPKGIPENEEDLMATAKREFFEETGITAHPPFHALGSIRQKGGKIVYAWAFTGDWAPEQGITGNTFALEWPPRSGHYQHFPEVDKAAWMTFSEVMTHIIPAQIPLIERANNLYDSNQLP